jgi:dihydrofolate reductase
MPKVQYYCATTLDGYIADPDDRIDWLTGYEGTYEGEGIDQGPMKEGGGYEAFYAEVGALVSGSVTYEWVLEHAEEWPYSGKPCWILSTRDLSKPEGEDESVRVVKGEIRDLYDEMAASAGEKNLWIVGGGPVASQFADAGLLDEVLLTVVPVVLGAGKPLFDRGLPKPLQLTGTRPFGNGMVELRYELRPDEG